MPRQREAMANAFRAQQKRVHQVPIRLAADVERLAAVEEEGDVDACGDTQGAEVEELRAEGAQGFAFGFFAY